MTRDSILAMKPGRELDALIATQFFGITVSTRRADDGTLLEPEMERMIGKHPKYAITEWTWVPWQHYSTRIGDAWRVVEHLGGWWNIERASDGKGWAANHGNRLVVCDAAPEAICKAALLATLEDEHA